MSYKNPNKQRKYQVSWLQRRRETFFKDKKCEACKGHNDLLLCGIRNKNNRTQLFSLSEEHRKRILKNTPHAILCRDCRYMSYEERLADERKRKRVKRILDKALKTDA